MRGRRFEGFARLFMLAALGLLGTLDVGLALAEPAPATVLSGRALLLPAVSDPPAVGSEALPSPAVEDAPLLAQLDELVAEAAQDLGLAIELGSAVGTAAEAERATRDPDQLVALAERHWVIAPRLGRTEQELRLTLSAVAPGSRVLLTRSQLLRESELEIRIGVMLAELVGARTRPSSAPTSPDEPQENPLDPTTPARSEGRGILALTSALIGAGVGYSLQRASGSDDPRLTYPLIALGAGVGLGSAVIAAEEWDLGTGDAWYLAAGALWPTTSGYWLAGGYRVTPSTDRYVYGMLGTVTGMTLASVSLASGDMSEGGALLTHSGGVYGTFLGGLVQMTSRGRTDFLPRLGMGYGAAAGVLSAGVAARILELSPSRVLFIDLAGSLGALTGAAAASPFLFVDTNETTSPSRQRLWLGSVGLGSMAGVAVGWALTRGFKSPRSSHTGLSSLQPFVIPWGATGTSEPASGMLAGVRGTL